MMIVELAILIYSVILHEISHGYVADKLGDPTARLSGRLTLDPRPHIDPLMTIGLPLILFLTGAGIIFGAAKPVPIDPFNFREPKKDIALTALAGPATNLLIAVILALLFRLYPSDILSTGVILNVGLALFNLIPIPPLDGFKVLTGILPDDLARDLASLERFGFTLIFIVLLFFPGVIFGLISPILHTILGFLLP
ncbi:site-2 protease family protein [Candidatus Microgenomates bacterium]|nr:site-2 protease family protein [Candidatus Microgenomates bacterium]